MTNEQLAEEIRQNGDKDLIPVLWDRVKPYMFTIAGRYYGHYASGFTRCGVELADIRQECYPAYLQALESFKIGEGHKFTSFLHFPLKNAMRELLGIRNGRKLNKSPLDNALSLNEPIPGGDDEDTDLIETIIDETAEQAFDDAMKAIEDEETRQALEHSIGKLTEQQRTVITLYFFEELPLKEIGRRLDRSTERISQIKKEALKKLRNDPDLAIFRAEQRRERSYHYGGKNFTESYFHAQKMIREYFKTGQHLSSKEERGIKNKCNFRAALEDHPELEAEYQMFDLLEKLAAKREELSRIAGITK